MSRRTRRSAGTATLPAPAVGATAIENLAAPRGEHAEVRAVAPAARAKSKRERNGTQPSAAPSRTSNRSRPDIIEIRVGDTLIHRTPPPVARSLRYLLAGDPLPRRFGVTASIHGEGATTMSRSLAALIAYDWRESVCWVDLNWWKVDQPRNEAALFDTTIYDVVKGNGRTEGLAVQTSIAGLSMVTSGDIPIAGRAQLPKSDELTSIIDELGRSFENVVFDLPPVLASSDAVTLSGFGEGYLFVVRQKAASSVQVRAALQTMNPDQCLGHILNGTRSHVPRWLRTSNEVWALGT